MDQHQPPAGTLETERIPLVGYRQAYDAIEAAFAGRRAFSLVRLGDGESAVLGFPDAVHPVRHARWMSSFFGPGLLAPEASARLRAGVEAAVAGAEVVGLHRERFREPKRAVTEALEIGANAAPGTEELRAINFLERRLLHYVVAPHLRATQLLTDANVHLDMHRSGLLVELMRRSEVVSIVSGNPEVAARLSDIFGGTAFELTLVPGEFKWAPDRADWEQRDRHFPAVFERVVQRIRGGGMRYLVLVGAGPCGKIYCEEVRRAGGMALDIGSILDLWCGRMTRSYMVGERRVVVQPA
jgi:hypothetical protein